MANTKKSNATNSKNKTAKRKSSVKKGKVYIAPYKIIVLCAAIIIVCMILLLATTVASSPSVKKEKTSITERFEKKPDNKVPEETENIKSPFHNSQNEEKKSHVKEDKKSEQIQKKDTTDKKKTSMESEVPKTEKKEPGKENSSTEKNIAPKPAVQKEEPQKTPPQNSKTENQTKGTESNKQNPTPATPQKSVETANPAEKSKFNFPQAKNNAQLIFVFDDGGQNLSHVDEFLKLPFPITVAVLPQIVHSTETAARVRKSGNEVILHQPMQSINSKVNPGPGAIKPDMSEDEIKSTLFQNINQIAPIAGMNNHEGSAITADAEKMAVVMQYSAEQGIYFLDSRTNVETKVPYVAKEMGYSYYERNIFLDNEKSRENALKELNKGLALANKNGSVIMIGHIWSADFLPALLQEAYPELKAKGYTFSVVSKSKAKK